MEAIIVEYVYGKYKISFAVFTEVVFSGRHESRDCTRARIGRFHFKLDPLFLQG